MVGPELVEKIKQDCHLPGDESAYLVEEWWRKTTASQFSWEKLQDAVLNVAERKYGPIIYHSDSMISGDSCKFVTD